MSNIVPATRSQGTREALLEAGVRVFAKLGYDAASTRHLASQAGVNLAAIPYHFESKKGLYLAVADYVAEQIARRLLPTVAAIGEQLGTPDFDDATARRALTQIQAAMVQLLVGTPEADSWAGFILREQAEPTEAFDVIYDKTMGRVLGIATQLVAQLTGAEPGDPQTRLRTITIMGQILIFRSSRAGVLRTLQWDGYTPERTQQILDVIVRHTDAILNHA